MNSEMNTIQSQNIKKTHRVLALFLCFIMLFSMFDSAPVSFVYALENTQKAETREEIKSRLMQQIKYEGWDPYSEDMSLDEFYALMELFDEGKLPLKTGTASGKPTVSSPGLGAPVMDGPGIDEPSSGGVYIPRTMFMFSGLGDYNGTENKPGAYSNDTGSPEDPINYPAGLDNYGMGYLCPPKSWPGVAVNGESQAVIIVKDTNKDKPQIAGDVDQSLFIAYPDRYVRRVTAQNTEVTILGAIKLSGQEEYVYYYLTSDMQSNDVSTTTLKEGQKFIVEYLPIEHEITYEVRMNSVGGTNVTNNPASVNVNGIDVEDTWENIIFGTNHPIKTDGGSYSFNAQAPYGYTVEIYYDNDTTPQLGKENKGDYTSVNGGWALGMHPNYSLENRFTLLPDPDKGPQALTISGTLYDNNLKNDRKVIAVVTDNGVPIFDAASIIVKSNGTSDRGTSAYNKVMTKDGRLVPYDYEDVYRWANGQESNYEYDVDHDTISYTGKTNLAAGNVATSDKWGWQDDQPQNGITYSTMEPQEDGTYSFRWTFQTNNNNSGNILDALQINGVSFRVPFLPKQKINNFPDERASGSGLKSWYTEGTLPDGATVRVEMLLGFNGTPQRVYRITVTGARSNVTVTGMNLMQGSGADEFVVYELEGVTGTTARNDNNYTEAIRYYSVGNGWGDLDSLDDNIAESNLVVHQSIEALEWKGDPALHGANIRFKLADGYDSPYFLWEAARQGIVIDGQSSINRNPDGTVDYDSMNPVLTFDELEDGAMMDSKHIYTDGSDWYYIRVTTQTPHKIALLTIIARPVRYVVRYVPSYRSVADNDPGRGTRDGSLVGIVDNPNNMPNFVHYEDKCHESFFNTDNAIPGEQYDDADGAYYDTAVDDVIILPSGLPTDPGGNEAKYRFVEWVLVDENYNPIWAYTDSTGNAVKVITDNNGNRMLVDENGYLAVLHTETGTDGDGEETTTYTLEASNVRVNWNNGSYMFADSSGSVAAAPDNMVLLTRDGKLANSSGTLIEMPKNTDYTALTAGWSLQDTEGQVVAISACSEFHYRSNHITLEEINQFAIPNENLGGNQTDIYVLRLMPVWEPIENPFHYRVALNWVDAQGNVTQEYFDDYWQEVLTNWTLEGGYLTVQIIKDATPFLDWIAQHPTYSFWDAVNNNNALYQYASEHGGVVDENGRAAMAEEMARAIQEYIPALLEDDPKVKAQYEEVLKALCTRDISGKNADGSSVTDNQGNGIDDFWRLGNYAYQVHEDEGTIVVWMYENKGGLIFNKDVQEEPFTADDEFYFTVANVIVGEENKLTGTYKAYPQQCYDEKGNPRATLDADAWLVSFVDGKIENIVKNDGSSWPSPAVTYFTLQDGEGIALYVPAGKYSIAELGSKSGGSYKVSVTYTATDGSMIPKEEWDIPNDDDLWLRGSLKEYIEPLKDGMGNYQTDENGKFIYEYPENVQQVTATVNFNVGEQDVVQTLTFANKTAALSVEKVLDASDEDAAELANYQNKDFYFDIDLKLPEGYTPIVKAPTLDDGGSVIDPGGYHYFNVNIFDVATGRLVRTTEIRLTQGKRVENDEEITVWKGSITLKAGQRAAIVMTAPDDEHPLYYEYTESGSEYSPVIEGEITDRNDIVDVSGVPCYRNANVNNGENCNIFYYGTNHQKVYIRSWNQIQYVTKTKGTPYLIHKNGDSLYYLVGSKADNSLDFRELPASLSNVNLHLAMVDGSYQVCEKKEVPLYSFDGSTFNLIQSMNILKEQSAANNVYYRYEDEYYFVELKSIQDSSYEDGPSFEDVYVGVYGEEIAMTLRKEFGVYSSRNGSDFFGVGSLDDIKVQVDTVELPVSKAIFNYWVEETWKQADWKASEWDAEAGKPKIFTEIWIGKSGIAEAGMEANAKVTNWYGEPPEDCYIAITETGGKPGETFLYKITNEETGEELIVSVPGGGETIVHCPAGNYTVEEITDWAWRYEDGECAQDMPIHVDASNNLTNPAHADFTNDRNEKAWLGGENSLNNRFADPSIIGEEQETNSRKQEYALPTITSLDDSKKKHDEGDDQ